MVRGTAPRVRRWLVRLGLLLVLIVLLVPTGVYVFLRGSLPRLTGQVQHSSLSGPVTIERDADGVPTVVASSDRDLSFAMGFLHAQERLFQMDLLRRAGAGELAGLLGSAVFSVDRARRVHRLRDRARATVESLDEAQRGLLEAYAAGVQAGIDDLWTLPFEYAVLGAKPVPWRAEDVLCAAYALFFTLQDAKGAAELRRSVIERALSAPLAGFVLSPGSRWDAPIDASVLNLPTVATATVGAVRPGPGRSSGEPDPVPGSNNWAVDGRRSTHGGAIVADDMHLGLRMPNIWYRVRQRVTGDNGYEVTGVSLPGAPIVVAGSNGKIAWGFTNAYIDTSDLVVIEPGPDAKTYLTPDGPKPFRRIETVIEVAGRPSETMTVVDTIWGPIIGRDVSGRQVALRWIAHDVGAVNLGLGAMSRVQTLEAAVAAAHGSGMANQNVMIATHDGRIGWTLSGRIPLRAEGCEGARPVSWADGRCAWKGFASPDQVPRVIDPPDGRLWTANNRIVGPERRGPVRYRGATMGARAHQIREGLFAKDKFAEADLLAIQLDDRALFLTPWRDVMLTRLKTDSRGPMRAAVENWGGRASPESVGYRVVRAFREAVLVRVVDSILAPAQRLIDEREHLQLRRLRPRNVEHMAWNLLQTRPDALLPAGISSWDAVLDLAIDDVNKQIEQQAGGKLEAYTWGAKNRLAMRHPMSKVVPYLGDLIDPPAEPLPGDRDMPRVQTPTHGASQRFVVSPGRESEGIFHMPGGQAAHPLSPYLHSGHAAWVHGEASSFLPGPTEWTMRLAP